MSNDNWYKTDSWYSPLQEEKTAEPRPRETAAGEIVNPSSGKAVPEKKKCRARFWGAAVLLLALVVGFAACLRGSERPKLSFRVSSGGRPAVGKEAEEEFPPDYADFFAGYYTSVTGQTPAETTNIERAAGNKGFTLTLKPAPHEEMSLQELYQQCAPSIVGISASVEGEDGYYWGSGVILSADGLLLTNAHIISGCDKVTVTLFDDTEYPALLVGTDSISDLAVLKIEADGLPAAEFGLSDSLAVGQAVAAIGNPLGSDFRFTLTDGIISGIDRGMSYNGRVMTLIQTNTAINNGNSGGALFNRCGQVIGVTNMKMVSYSNDIEGIGFAIPSSTVKTISETLIRDGEVIRTTIGITCGGIPEKAAEHYGLPGGLYIMSVTENYDAAEKGIQPGDILTAVNGIPVTTTNEVNTIKDTFGVGDTLTLQIWRAGESFSVDITLLPAA